MNTDESMESHKSTKRNSLFSTRDITKRWRSLRSTSSDLAPTPDRVRCMRSLQIPKFLHIPNPSLPFRHRSSPTTVPPEENGAPRPAPKRGARGFAVKFYDILSNEPSDIITWTKSGLAFQVVDYGRFSEEILQKDTSVPQSICNFNRTVSGMLHMQRSNTWHFALSLWGLFRRIDSTN